MKVISISAISENSEYRVDGQLMKGKFLLHLKAIEVINMIRAGRVEYSPEVFGDGVHY